LNKTQLNQWLAMAESKSEIAFKGFTSTSLQRSVAEQMMKAKAGRLKKNETDVLLIIEGKTCRPIEELSQFSGRFEGLQNQHEALFDDGGRFRFDYVEQKNGTYVFYMHEN
ncbi:MAG: hypothetical protein K2H70_03245, partial [Bacteroidales bacterium]|nr:hypothetical protein [Bacteroidales bacterium]